MSKILLKLINLSIKNVLFINLNFIQLIIFLVTVVQLKSLIIGARQKS